MYWKRTAFLYVPVPQSVLFICQVKTIVFQADVYCVSKPSRDGLFLLLKIGRAHV